MPLRYDRFSFRAKDAIQHAAEITRRYGHILIDTEHLLLALIEQAQSGIPALLVALNVDTSYLVDRVVFSLRASPKTGIPGGTIDKYQATARVMSVFEQAKVEAETMQDETISSPHLFLAILHESGTPAALILTDARLTYESVFMVQKAMRDGKVLNQYKDVEG